MALVESFSGIRGIYGTELTEDIAKSYSYSYFQYLKKINPDKKLKIVIGRDSRHSGKNLFEKISSVLDCDIIDIGMLPTPLIENAVRDFKADGGIIITASHNEPEYNGFKFLEKNGAVLSGESMEFIISAYNNIKSESLNIELNDQTINEKRKQAIDFYKIFIKKILGECPNLNKFKIIIDPNGGSGIISKEIFEDYTINAEYLNMDEGDFNRLVEPTKDSLKYLIETLNKNNADFAVGFDCDADRIEIILKNGELVSGNQILYIITEYILSKSKQPTTVVVNDATSYMIKEITEKNRSKFIEVEVGETNVTNMMEKHNSFIGGEGSNGGIIIPPSKCRDGILTTIFLLKILHEKNISLNELIKKIPVYYYLKEKIRIKDNFINIRDKIEDYYTKKGFIISKTGDNTGGLKAIKDNSWIWFRQSKTEDKVLRIISDSLDETISKELIKEAKSFLESI